MVSIRFPGSHIKPYWREAEEERKYLFSGVTCPKSAVIMAALLPFVRSGLSVHVPKYFLPRALNLISILAGATTAVCGKANADVANNRKVDFILKSE
jgi:hypothetical protein